MKKSNPSIALLLLPLLIGCNSFSSTALNRFDNDNYSGQSNGDTACHDQARPFRGIPITLKVPTHLDVYVDETYFIKLTENRAEEPLDGQLRLLNVRASVVESDKVFTVDFKRPAAGFLDLDIDFDEEEQYFKKIVSQLEDNTITETAELISQVRKSITAFSSSTGAELTEENKDALAKSKIIQDSRVVAYQRFDLNSPTFEQDVECFVNKHLNACNRCSTDPDYDRARTP